MNDLAWLFQVPRSRCHLREGGANRDPGVSLLHNLVRAVPSERTNHAREKGMVIGYDASATPGRRDDRDTEGLGEEAQLLGRLRELNTSADEQHRILRRRDDLHRPRSEEHTSELQSLMRISYAVFCLK